MALPDDMLIWKLEGCLKDEKELGTWVYDVMVTGGKCLTHSENMFCKKTEKQTKI